MATKARALAKELVKSNIQSLQKWLRAEGLDAFYISSFDPYLSEYVPLDNSHRFYLTNFSGSVAEVLVLSSGKIKLYVDARYHEQADLQVDASIVEVVKCQDLGIATYLTEDIRALKIKNIGVESDRTSYAFLQRIKELSSVKTYANQELDKVCQFGEMNVTKPIYLLEDSVRGRSTQDKLAQVVSGKDEAYFITALDSLAWITNCRGYHMPNLSSFMGRGLVTHNNVFVFVDKTTPLDSHLEKAKNLSFIACDTSEIAGHMQEIQNKYDLSRIYFDPAGINAADYEMLNKTFGKQLVKKLGGLVEFHSIKDDFEIELIRESFNKADTAIYNTICWVKQQVAQGQAVSELDLHDMTSKKYQEQGAIEQSFGTIAGVGANGSIIHYGDPKADVMIAPEKMCLLDSGGYFAAGFATDTTRTFMGAYKAGSSELKRMYTLVLKGTLQVQYAVFPEGTNGAYLDALARKAIFESGQNYGHGTGHGVGIHVHEGGAGLRSNGSCVMKERQVVSIEPGLYKPGLGGVRLENIALVKKHPTIKGFLCFENLVWIGFEPELIDHNLLSDQERIWLEDYEAICKEKGRSFFRE